MVSEPSQPAENPAAHAARTPVTGRGPSPNAPVHPALGVLVALVRIEAVLMLALGAVLTVALATARRQSQIGFTLAEIGGCVLVGVLLGLMARGLRAGRRWPRSPAILLQLLGLPSTGWSIRYGGWGFGLPIAALLLSTLVLLFATTPSDARG